MARNSSASYPQLAVAPPLVSWFVALVACLSAGAVVCVFAALKGAPASIRFVDFNTARIESLSQPQSPRPATVVMLGSSALKYATRDEESFASRLSERLGRPVRVLRLVNNWGVFGDFEPLGSAILRLDPALVVIQRDFLVTDRPWHRQVLLLFDHLRWRLLGGDAWDYRNEDPALVQFDHPCWHRPGVDAIGEQNRRLGEWVIRNPDAPGPTAARAFVSGLVDARVRVALLHVPLRPDFEATLDRGSEGAIAAAAVEASGGLVVDWSPGILPRPLYCDVTHVTPAGSEKYSHWLEDRLVQALERPAS